MGGVQKLNNFSDINTLKESENKFIKIKNLILSNFSDKVFTSKNIQTFYFDFFNEKISLSTVSTYLSRLVDKGILHRGGSSGTWHYAVSSNTKLNY